MARVLRFLRLDLLQTLLRMLPFPSRTGLVQIGTPGPSAPVLLTGNFQLTVERVRRALRGLDAYLLVANSRGVNVWCAATGGLLTNHDVVSVLKTSGIEERVDHRRVILPQLAATGIDGRVVHEKTGWKVVWGPADAAALPAFLEAGMEATRAMRTVGFPWNERLEMGLAWAFPISLLALVAAPFWPDGAWPLVAMVWLFSLSLFLGFPLYATRLHARQARRATSGWAFPDPVILVPWAFFVAALVAGAVLARDASWAFVLRWSAASLGVLLVLGLDLTGSTPVYKSGLQADRLLRIELDAERCRGAGFCERVCPKDVFAVDHHRRLATLPRAEECVQCGACIVQCPFDALFFRSPTGDTIPPDTIRRFKLNLLGTRGVAAAPRDPGRQANVH